ncbi:succinate dehydrogenase [Halarcobacter ebronensis]|uniref:Fumarate reductase iron-sulfur subunit n=1 Tax=Halarcobacter ebronensis TaxID=1462615 RepID=A0A4Q0YHP4_9BACT|nr:2Fe-2S iron-sulfur cluster-binding protein [Halarcobacter ebronensis]RXJ68619.1 succinate dehydrogenase [Halarcobacter ebronensis]
MKIKIKRYNKEKNEQTTIEEYSVNHNETILNSLIEVKTKYDNSLGFRCGCKSGVCGSCAIRVNGVEKLACKTHLEDEDLIEPIKNTEVLKDLIVSLHHEENLLKIGHTFLNSNSLETITKEDEKKIDRQSTCILCQSCYSSCPVYEVNKEFLGPYALTRALRYVDDKKESTPLEILKNIQTNGIWDCTLCGYCTIACPQFIDPKSDIMSLRIKSVQNGFEDKSLSAFNSSFDLGFNNDFGFNPNGF